MFVFFIVFLHQLTVNCWFGAFSGLGFKTGTPKNPNPFHFRGISRNPNHWATPQTNSLNHSLIIDLDELGVADCERPMRTPQKKSRKHLIPLFGWDSLINISRVGGLEGIYVVETLRKDSCDLFCSWVTSRVDIVRVHPDTFHPLAPPKQASKKKEKKLLPRRN